MGRKHRNTSKLYGYDYGRNTDTGYTPTTSTGYNPYTPPSAQAPPLSSQQPLTLDGILGGLGSILNSFRTAVSQTPTTALPSVNRSSSLPPVQPPQPITEFPVKDIAGNLGSIAGGIGNILGGLLTSENWWIILVIIFLLFPDSGKNIFKGLFRESKA